MRAAFRFARWIALSIAGAGIWAPGAPAQNATAASASIPAASAAKDTDFFEKSVRPILIGHCYKCHSAQAEKTKGGLLLDHRQTMLQGGKTGPAIVPGKPEASLLIKAVRYTDDDLQMPPKVPLSAQAVADLTSWVEMGAPWPAEAAPATAALPDRISAGKNHWAFQPIRATAPPAPRDGAWAKNDIDRFILAKLKSKGLAPAPPADKRTLIRRAYFDLIGLPPTPAQVEAFARDRSRDAFARVVDQLLASPRYGERWGRYWLDLARYADTNGADENYAFPDAWRYRDYVVRSFNADKPYNQFVTEQLAGDLLPDEHASESEKRDRLIATGFLALGPKMLAEQDKPKLVMDVIDEQIDVIGRTFLGLTLGCARCHDHKFDPIPTADYYALAGIFKSTRTMANLDHVSDVLERDLPDSRRQDESRRYEARLASAKAELAAFTQAKTIDRAPIPRAGAAPPPPPHPREPGKPSAKTRSAASPADAKHLKDLRARIAEIEKNKPRGPQAMAVAEGTPQNIPIHLRGSHLTLAREPTPRGFVRVLDACATPPRIPAGHSGRLELAKWITDQANPLTARVMVNRIWQGHFGMGLAASPSNFGLRGSPPSHPALLDFLASRFIHDGGSIKRLHRFIMLSSTYQMSSAFDAGADEIDPENQLLRHQNRRRLEAEPIRDALLAIGGNLDLAMGGSIVKPAEGKYSAVKIDDPVYDSTRRAIYLPIVRTQMYDLFAIFDYNNAGVHTGLRPVTTVPQQALFMLNSRLVAAQANLLARHVLAREKDDAARLRLIYETLYARPPTATERTRAMAHLASFSEEDRAAKTSDRAPANWQSLCRVLLAANEFIYVN